MRAALALALLLTGCGASPLDLLTGGGPHVAANVQAAKTATQTIGQTSVSESRIEGATAARDIRQSTETNRLRADQVQTVVVNELPAWAVLLMLVGWLMDSPLRWPGQIANAFRRKDVNARHPKT